MSAQAGDLLRGKWLMDGAQTLSQAAEHLEAEAARLRALEAQGWTLAAPVEDDYGVLADPLGSTGEGPTDA